MSFRRDATGVVWLGEEMVTYRLVDWFYATQIDVGYVLGQPVTADLDTCLQCHAVVGDKDDHVKWHVTEVKDVTREALSDG